MLVLVTGATGFVGRRVVAELLERHHQVRCYVHTPGRERLFDNRSVEVRYGGVSDPDALAEAFHGVEAVVHLVGVIRQSRGRTFDLVNRQGTADVVGAAKASGAKHLVQLSAIGAGDDREYPYLFSKWRAEQEVINSGLPYTILRSPIMFGEGDEFLNALAAMVRVFPLVPVVGSGRNRFQPIAVERCSALRCLVSRPWQPEGPHGGDRRPRPAYLQPDRRRRGSDHGEAAATPTCARLDDVPCRYGDAARPAPPTRDDRPAQDAGYP